MEALSYICHVFLVHPHLCLFFAFFTSELQVESWSASVGLSYLWSIPWWPLPDCQALIIISAVYRHQTLCLTWKSWLSLVVFVWGSSIYDCKVGLKNNSKKLIKTHPKQVCQLGLIEFLLGGSGWDTYDTCHRKICCCFTALGFPGQWESGSEAKTSTEPENGLLWKSNHLQVPAVCFPLHCFCFSSRKSPSSKYLPKVAWYDKPAIWNTARPPNEAGNTSESSPTAKPVRTRDGQLWHGLVKKTKKRRDHGVGNDKHDDVLDDSLHEIHDEFWSKSDKKMEIMKDWKMIVGCRFLWELDLTKRFTTRKRAQEMDFPLCLPISSFMLKSWHEINFKLPWWAEPWFWQACCKKDQKRTKGPTWSLEQHPTHWPKNRQNVSFVGCYIWFHPLNMATPRYTFGLNFNHATYVTPDAWVKTLQ